VPSTAGLAAGGVGLVVDVALGRTFAGGVVGGVVSAALCTSLLLLLRRSALKELVEIFRERSRGRRVAAAAR
jgi:hypothetical protein